MGVQGLYQHVNKEISPCPYKEVSFKHFAGQTLVFDTKALAYQFLFAASGGSHLTQFIHIVNDCLKFKITPIFVFDGHPPKSKQAVNNNRMNEKLKWMKLVEEQRSHLTEKKKTLALPTDLSIDKLDAEDLIHIAREDIDDMQEMEDQLTKTINSRVTVSTEQVDEIWIMLYHMGVRCIRAHSEGEALCALMNRFGLADVIVSEDSDVLPFGGLTVLKNFKTKSKRDTEKMHLYDLKCVLEKMELSLEELIEVCSLTSNDFNNGKKIPGFGFKTALKSIKSSHTIENVIREKIEKEMKAKKKPTKAFVVPEGYDPNASRKEFYSYSFFPKPFEYISTFKTVEPRIKALIQFLNEKNYNTVITHLLAWYRSLTGKDYEPNMDPEDSLYCIKQPKVPSLTPDELETIEALFTIRWGNYEKSTSLSSSSSMNENKIEKDMEFEIVFDE